MNVILDGKYEIKEELGRGNFGVVYKAVDLRLGRIVAIKEINEGIMTATESETLKKINHEGIPKIYDFWSEEKTEYLVMEYIEGVTLLQYLNEKNKLTEYETVDIAIQICDILESLHNLKPAIIYRDLKPSNVKIKPDGRVVLLDMGAAFEKNYDDSKKNAAYGTRGYSAPELFNKKMAEPSADVYSVGVLIYEMLTGIGPRDILSFNLNLHSLDRSISKKLANVVNICLREKAADRYQSIETLKKNLLSLIKSGSLTCPKFAIKKSIVILGYIFALLTMLNPILNGREGLCYEDIRLIGLSIASAVLIHMFLIYIPLGRRSLVTKEKEIWLTEKRFPGLFVLFVLSAGVLTGFGISLSNTANAEEKVVFENTYEDLADNLMVVPTKIKDEYGRYVILKEGSLYPADNLFVLEIEAATLPDNPVSVEVLIRTESGKVYESRMYKVQKITENK